ncbi:MAG: hypothetical protein HYR60_07905, partial [Acidobacteria bacterium]|nr:hypothetical protein [Acidobacteriota bacterium]
MTGERDLNRRGFLTAAGLAATRGAAATRGVALVIDPADAVAGAPPPQWAAQELEDSLAARGVAVHRCARVAQAPAGDLCVVAAGRTAGVAQDILKGAGIRVAAIPEALGLAQGTVSGRPVLLACGHDPAGLVYALLDLADRVQNAADPLTALSLRKPFTERPANAIRGVARLFTSDVEDKPWFNDRQMWPPYLTLLAAQRFNRFHLAFGIGYDFLRNVTDGYFLFAYPFLLPVPGYNVRVPQLPDSERDHNLAMLKFVSEQTVVRGLRFQLGLWMH